MFIPRINMTTATLKKMPIPVRLDEPEDDVARSLAHQTGLTKSEVIRRACRFSLHKFASGEVDISRVVPTVLS